MFKSLASVAQRHNKLDSYKISLSIFQRIIQRISFLHLSGLSRVGREGVRQIKISPKNLLSKLLMKQEMFDISTERKVKTLK